MRTPTYALLWEIWRRNRTVVAVIAAVTVAGRILDASERASGSVDPSALVGISWMVSFGLLFGIFNYIESSDGRGLGRFPERLFVLPVSSLRLVAIPVLTGIASVELLYLLWLDPLSRGASTSAWFVGLLLGASMVCYQAVFWTLERLGPLRLIVVGVLVFSAFGVGLLPSFPPSPPPPWRSEAGVAAMAVALAGIVFLFEWRYIERLRTGSGRRLPRESLLGSAAIAWPRARRPFSSPAAAQFWFEWRCSGLALPVLVGGVLLAVIAPYSWFARDAAAWSFQLLYGTLAMPIILAIPVGMAFGRPTFWSDDLSMPAFVAVRPLTDEDIVAIKLKVAAVSVVVSWVLVLVFLGVWLSLWGNLDGVSQFAIQLWAFHGHSAAAVYGIAALIVIAGMLLTWRFLVIRLWSGLSGNRPLFIASVMALVIVVIAWMVFDGTRLPGWVLEGPARMAAVVWILAIAVITKYWLAAFSWRSVSVRYARQYLLVWGAATTCLLAFALSLWGVAKIYVALDIYRFQGLMILFALLVIPVARLGFAPSCLARNRHRLT